MDPECRESTCPIQKCQQIHNIPSLAEHQTSKKKIQASQFQVSQTKSFLFFIFAEQ
jgi:hypothetical protein